jgi:hypothetical protein
MAILIYAALALAHIVLAIAYAALFWLHLANG